MKTILISGKSGHGKDTFANFLVEEFKQLGYNDVLVAHFGDPVKWFAKQYYGYRGIKDEFDRGALQTMGTMMRRYDENYWANITCGFLAANEKFSNIAQFAIVPDLRYLSEYNTAKRLLSDCYTVRINRYENGELYKNPLMSDYQRRHHSENELDDFTFDAVIKNDGDLEFLKIAAHDFVELVTD